MRAGRLRYLITYMIKFKYSNTAAVIQITRQSESTAFTTATTCANSIYILSADCAVSKAGCAAAAAVPSVYAAQNSPPAAFLPIIKACAKVILLPQNKVQRIPKKKTARSHAEKNAVNCKAGAAGAALKPIDSFPRQKLPLPMVGIIDYNAGNIRSVARALTAIGASFSVAKTPQELSAASRLIFPGVGDAAYAMAQLKKSGFDSFLRDKVQACVPILGICLGSQIIFDYSEEGDTECLGLVPGTIRHFNSVWTEAQRSGRKIPHMGWNDVAFSGAQSASDPILAGIADRTDFYFVHSYCICPCDSGVVLGTAEYGCAVPAVLRSGSVWALQFHPEKSGAPGLRMLQNFIREDAQLSGEVQEAAC